MCLGTSFLRPGSTGFASVASISFHDFLGASMREGCDMVVKKC